MSDRCPYCKTEHPCGRSLPGENLGEWEWKDIAIKATDRAHCAEMQLAHAKAENERLKANIITSEVAVRLVRELAEAKAEVERLKGIIKAMCWDVNETSEGLRAGGAITEGLCCLQARMKAIAEDEAAAEKEK